MLAARPLSTRRREAVDARVRIRSSNRSLVIYIASLDTLSPPSSADQPRRFNVAARHHILSLVTPSPMTARRQRLNATQSPRSRVRGDSPHDMFALRGVS